MRLVLLFVLSQLSAALKCYNARDIGLEKAFGFEVYSENAKPGHLCRIRAIYDGAPNAIVSVSMYPEKNATKRCWIETRRYPKDRAEHALQLRTYDLVILNCRCDQDYCNLPELIMDHFGGSRDKFSLIFGAFDRIRNETHIKTTPLKPKYWAITFTSLSLAVLMFLANFVYAAVVVVKRGREAGQEELFAPPPKVSTSAEMPSEEVAD